MKYIHAISFFCIVCLSLSCTNKPERPATLLTADRIAAADAAAQQNATTLAATGGVQHYYCANNCAGSGGDAAGTCPTCGTEYTHNQAWHNQNAVSTSTTSNIQDVSTNITPPGQATPEPPQNAAGVWHYTCPNGHSGGAGAATPCSECGTTLVHNTLYHQ